MNVLEVTGLNKSFPGTLFKPRRQILHDVSFRLPQGETCGFVGGNGQGKTTTIKCLFSFIRPDSGAIRFFGQPLEATKSRIGYLPERPYLHEFLTGWEFLRLHWNLANPGRPSGFIDAAARALARVELTGAADRSLRSYSKGMLQRIGIAQALLHEPELLILDEPMSGLDPDGRILVKEILREQKQAGVSIFFSSHLLQDMDELCGHLTVIDAGRIVFDGSTPAFRRDHADLENAFRAMRAKGIEGRA